MRQLAETGWMHNRLRMITAMFLSKHLLLDWRLGERHFMEQLVDGDFAANNGGWQWSASTGTDAAPYFRIFNPQTQAKRFDPDGDFIRRWVPELRNADAKALHHPDKYELPRGYPRPIVDHKEARERALETFKAAGSG
jgi:deoxyribodipyrimidine photo-lyase